MLESSYSLATALFRILDFVQSDGFLHSVRVIWFRLMAQEPRRIGSRQWGEVVRGEENEGVRKKNILINGLRRPRPRIENITIEFQKL